MFAYLIAWGVFYGLHSLLAAGKIKVYFKSTAPSFFPYYRLAYNLFHLIFSAILLWWGISCKGALLYERQMVVGILFLISGLTLSLMAFRSFDIPAFLGVDVVSSSSKNTTELIQTGLYAWVRHPLYSGIVLIILGIICCLPYQPLLLFAAVTFVYLPFGIYWEEEKLRREFGPVYDRYAQGVKRLIPGVW